MRGKTNCVPHRCLKARTGVGVGFGVALNPALQCWFGRRKQAESL